MEIWRIFDTGARLAAENMALDETLLELKLKEKVPHGQPEGMKTRVETR